MSKIVREHITLCMFFDLSARPAGLEPGESEDKMNIEELRRNMTAAGVYSKADIEKICKLEEQYLAECEAIAEECEAEGYPDHGSNYDLRCADARRYYDDLIEEIDSSYGEREDD